MKVPHTVAAKLSDDPELLQLLRTADPDAFIPQRVAILLNVPDVPPEQEDDAFWKHVELIGENAAATFAAIKGLTVHNLIAPAAMASVSGTAEALITAIESDSVMKALLGDRIQFRGASRG